MTRKTWKLTQTKKEENELTQSKILIGQFYSNRHHESNSRLRLSIWWHM